MITCQYPDEKCAVDCIRYDDCEDTRKKDTVRINLPAVLAMFAILVAFLVWAFSCIGDSIK